MMKLIWTNKSLSDLARLYEFLAAVNEKAAVQVLQKLTTAPHRLLQHPRLGKKIERYLPREVRHFFIEYYEIRYEIKAETIYVLRLWHTKENR